MALFLAEVVGVPVFVSANREDAGTAQSRGDLRPLGRLRV
jgi:hypothetical protein